MSADYTMNQQRGRINIVESTTLTLGERGSISDSTAVAGTQLRVNTSGTPIDVIVCRKDGATAGLVGGLGVTFGVGEEGYAVDALSGAAGQCDGIIDPDISTALAAGDTFLLFVKGPINYVSGAAVTAGAQIKPAASGRMIDAVGNEGGVGRATILASGAAETVRGFFDFSIARNGLIA
jgi:hypothetical protein